MRRLPAAAAAVSLLAIALVGCSATSSPTCEPAQLNDAIGDLVTITDVPDEGPEVEVPAPLQLKELQSARVIEGDGQQLVDINQVFEYGLTLVNGKTGETLVSTGYTEGPLFNTFAAMSGNFAGLQTALMCTPAGSRVVVGLSPEDVTEGLLASAGLDEDTTLVAMVDVKNVLLPAADGVSQYHDGGGVPTVVLGAGGQPGVIVPDGGAPDERIVQLLKKGEHEVPEAGSYVAVNYTVVNWSSREVSKTTWGTSPEPVGIDDSTLIGQVLQGVPVGSQVLVVDPGAEGSTDGVAIYVIDVLGVVG